MITVWNPTPGDVDLFPRRLLFGEAPPKWPGMPELVAVLWEMGLLPHVRRCPIILVAARKRPADFPTRRGATDDANAGIRRRHAA